jgi:hypothetical protein
LNAYVYDCSYQKNNEINWDEIECVRLTDAASGEPARLQTIVKLCRSDAYVHVRFECEDDHVAATYENRDDPIYKEDVVEIFIDEVGTGRFYKEFELSPLNVLFDALIEKEEGRGPKVDTSWDMEGLETRVSWPRKDFAVYEWRLPVDSFDTPPTAGTVWRINLYRIDEDPAGKRHYWAWSPTKVVNFHTPAKFGELHFK